MKKKAIQISSLSKSYSDGFLALNDVSLEIESGDFFGLLGPNGAGKTTLIGILSSLVNKTSGSVSVLGLDLDKNSSEVKQKIGLVPQEFNFNIFEQCENILIQQAGYYGVARDDAVKRAQKRLQQLGLWEKRKTAVRHLSGGMKRRLMIARALMHNPDVIILDEPTAGVDLEIRHSLWDLMRQINEEGVTVILTTHYLEEAESMCKRIAIIDKGRIIENTDINSLLSKQNKDHYIFTFESAVSDLSLPGFKTKKLDESIYEIELNSGQNMTKIVEKLSAQGIHVKRVGRTRTRLEELFLELTSEMPNE